MLNNLNPGAWKELQSLFKFHKSSTIHLIKLCSVPIWPIVEQGIQNDDAHDVLVEVKAQLVELARPSVEHHGVEVDRPQVDEIHELPPDLAEW